MGVLGEIKDRLDRRHKNLVVEGDAFDHRWGVATAGFVELADLPDLNGRATHGFAYVPTGPRIFNTFLAALPTRRGDYTFVDLGAGKGRTLILASEAGFGRAVGVEFSSELTAVAEQNVGRYRERASTPCEIECINADAGRYRFSDERLVVYLHNPFSEVVMEQVLGNLRISLARTPREVWLCYLQLKKEDPSDVTANVERIAASGLFESRPVGRALGDRWTLSPFDLRVFRTARPNGSPPQPAR